MEDLAAECDNPLRCSTIISRNSTGASINYGHTESHGVVEAGIVMKDLYHIIDDSTILIPFQMVLKSDAKQIMRLS